MEKDQEKALAPGLYMVATPIGNLEDISLRALRVLREVDWIAAEDTRESRKLLDAHGISTPLHSFHEHSTERKLTELVDRLKEGGAAAYISDAGTPGISDPGADLVRAAREAGVKVLPVPGASAPIALLSASGFAGTAFKFHGFFPREKKERELWAKQLAREGGTHVFFESPHRIRECLLFLAKDFSEKELLIGRELTKRFETISQGSVAKLAEFLLKEEARGEYVLALNLGDAPRPEGGLSLGEVESLLGELAETGANQRALLRVAMSHGMAKNSAYDLALRVLQKYAKP